MTHGKARYYSTKTAMKDFTETLANQLGKPVSDSTGLSGKYDVTMSWNPANGGRTGPSAPATAPVNDESEFGVTIESAVQSQLGLKLEPKKGMIETMVIDKAEKTPTEN